MTDLGRREGTSNFLRRISEGLGKREGSRSLLKVNLRFTPPTLPFSRLSPSGLCRPVEKKHLSLLMSLSERGELFPLPGAPSLTTERLEYVHFSNITDLQKPRIFFISRLLDLPRRQIPWS